MRRFALLGLVALLALPTAPARAGDGLIDLGTVVGAGLGGLVGNQIGKGTGKTVATVAGVILGGVAGHSVDRNWSGNSSSSYRTMAYEQPMEPVGYAYQPNYVAPPAPQIVYYNNDDDDDEHEHHHGRGHDRGRWHGQNDWRQPVPRETRIVYSTPSYTPVQQPLRDDGYCREYNNRVVVGGRVQNSYGHACLQPDGSWRIVD